MYVHTEEEDWEDAQHLNSSDIEFDRESDASTLLPDMLSSDDSDASTHLPEDEINFPFEIPEIQQDSNSDATDLDSHVAFTIPDTQFSGVEDFLKR